MTQQTPYIGSKISLISKLDIRYEGILYTVDSKESTIALSKVRSFGTEDRSAAHVVPPQDEVYDYIIFKANDIKDLIVCETPKPAAPGLPYDPAILSVSQGEKPPVPSQDEKPTSPVAGPAGSNQSRGTGSNQNRGNGSNQNRGTGNNRPPQAQQRGNWKFNGGNTQPNHGNANNRPQGQQRGNWKFNGNTQPNRGNGNNRPHGQNQRTNLKFDSDYDFEKAYEQFKETLDSIVGDVQNIKIDDSHENDAGSVKSCENNESFYDKTKSFFDSISCEALEKEEGKNTRPDWRKERLTNQETFGRTSAYGYRRGGYTRGGYSHGGNGNNGGNGNYRGGYSRGGNGNNGGNGNYRGGFSRGVGGNGNNYRRGV